MRASTNESRHGPPLGPRRALVLSGGGARGAYEAGVLRYLFEELPEDLGWPPQFDIITGTSVGAIHACFVAATAHIKRGRSEPLRHVWEGLDVRALFGSPARTVVRLPATMASFFGHHDSVTRPPERLFGFLNTERLERLVIDAIPWGCITKNIRERRVEALSVAATEVATGRVVVFVQTEPPGIPSWTRDASVVARSASIGPTHALASAAIPFLFPGVRVEGSYYVDGGLRLNTPLAPALRLGADRVLLVAITEGPKTGHAASLEALRIKHFGNPFFLLGKLLDALLLDRVKADLEHMRLLNDILQRVRDTGGPSVLDAVNATVRRDRGQPFKIIEDVVVRPSADLGLLAGEVAARLGRASNTGIPIRLILKTLGFGHEPLEADLLSYVFFDASYTSPLMQLGLEDARQMRDQLIAFFTD